MANLRYVVNFKFLIVVIINAKCGCFQLYNLCHGGYVSGVFVFLSLCLALFLITAKLMNMCIDFPSNSKTNQCTIMKFVIWKGLAQRMK